MTPKQEAFCKEYVIDLNATQAFIRAGYSAKTAGPCAGKLLKKPEIQTRIQVLMDKRAARVEVSADKILQQLALMGFSDIRELFDAAGNIKNIHDMPDGIAASIQAIDVVKKDFDGEPATVHKIKLADKQKSMELLGKHLKLFTDRVEHSVDEGLMDRLVSARQRALPDADTEGS